MKFGIDLPVHGPYSDPALLVELGCEAEAAGWDGFFLWDHINWIGKAPKLTDPWVVLSAVAAKTEHIRLGTMVTPLPRRRPWKVAREAVALDHLSQGRFILGVGLGAFPKPEFAAFGEPSAARTRADMLDEALSLLDAFWSGESVSFSGEHYQIDNVKLLPTPIQQPRIPIWVAGSWPHKRPMRRAARWDGAFPLQSGAGSKRMATAETMAEIHAYVSKHRQSDAPFDLVHWGLSAGNDTETLAMVETYRQAGVSWWLENANTGRGSIKKIRERIQMGPPRT